MILKVKRRSPVVMSSEEFRSAGHRLVDRIADFIHSLPQRPVTAGESPAVVREALDAGRGLPEQGADAGELLERAAELMFDHSLFNGHPRFFGYITSSPAPIGMLADFLAAAVNPNVGSWRLGPVATEIEAQTVRWIAELLGYPTTCGGLLVVYDSVPLRRFLRYTSSASSSPLRTCSTTCARYASTDCPAKSRR